MRLDDFLAEAGITQGELGKKLDPEVSQGNVSHWINGRQKVGLDHALQIEAISDGKVTPHDLVAMFREGGKKAEATA